MRRLLTDFKRVTILKQRHISNHKELKMHKKNARKDDQEIAVQEYQC